MSRKSKFNNYDRDRKMKISAQKVYKGMYCAENEALHILVSESAINGSVLKGIKL